MIVTLEQIAVFGLIMSRMTGMLMMAPFFNRREIISLGKAALIFWVSIIFMFVIPLPVSLPNSTIAYAFAVACEMLIGFILSYSIQILVQGFEFAGMLIDNQSSLGATNLLDPSTGSASTSLQKLLQHLITTVFLVMNAHHLLLSGIFQSFKILPLGHPFETANLIEMVMYTGTDVFVVALHMAMPTLIIIFLIDYCLGMVNRIAPQVNVFQFGMQLKPTISMWVFALLAPAFVDGLYMALETTTETFLKMFLFLQVQ